MDINVIVDSIQGLIATWGLKVLGGILVLIGGWIVSKAVRNSVRRRLAPTRLDDTLARFFASLAGILVLIATVLAALNLVGFAVTSLIAVLGAAGLAVGLALQGTLSNFAAGVMLLITRPFKVGDVVSVAGVTAKVHEIELFITTFDTVDNRRIIVPNSEIFGSIIETITYHDTRRVDVAVGVDYGADIDETRRVLGLAVSEVQHVLDAPAPQVYLLELADSSVNWAVRVWCATADYWTVREDLTRAVKMQLDQAGIGIPFPQMDVHLDGALANGNGMAATPSSAAADGSRPAPAV